MNDLDLISYAASSNGALAPPEAYVRSLSNAGVTHIEGRFQISTTPTLKSSMQGISFGRTKTTLAYFSMDIDPNLRKP